MVHIYFKASGTDYKKIGKFLGIDNLIVYPTDTVYGVGARMESENAIKKIYEAKSRDFTSPLIALVSSRDIVFEIASLDDNKQEPAKKLMEKFWPGGLTIIFKKKANIPEIMVSGGDTVGIRMPNHPVALKVIESAGGVLPTTSANISGQPTPKSYTDISQEFKERVDIIIDGGVCPIGTESTIIDMSGEKIKILRAGAITKEEIEAVIGPF
ncbi:MAG: L-threonylcarbamoyladenylate synthase [Fusobacteriaceae bacterium]